MDDKAIARAREQAERAVMGMEDGPLKVKAFEVVFSRLLREEDRGKGERPQERGSTKADRSEAGTAAGRILSLRVEGFFNAQRSLAEVRDRLASRGWHYPLTSLSGVMQKLVRQRKLRRERVKNAKRQVWKYSKA